MTGFPRALLSLLTLVTLAAPAAADERFAVTPAGAGPQHLDLPPAFLSASARGDLSDLRLHDAAGTEVPYLLVAPPETKPALVLATRIRPIPPTKAESGAEIDLGSLREVAGLALEFGSSGDGQRWTTLLEGEALYALPLDPGACGGAACPGALVRQQLHFPAARVRYLRLVLNDQRSPRIAAPVTARARLAGTGAPPAGPAVPLALADRQAEPGVSRFALRLPGPHLPVRAIVLDVGAARLARKARVLEERLAGGRLTPVELGSATLVAVEREGVVVSELRIPVSAPEELELELVVEDGDNPGLPLRGAQAELSPLPWIFFESKDGAPLEARLGDPELHAPHYDLEALRPELARLSPGRAATSSIPALTSAAAPPSPAVAAAGDAAAPGAVIDPKAFRYARSVSAAQTGLVAVRLDADVLSRSADLFDLRLADDSGRQIPYLLEQRDEPLAVQLDERSPSSPPASLKQRGMTLHELSSPKPAFPVSRLVLSTRARVFSREVRIYVEPDRPGSEGPLLLASASWSHADPGRAAPALTVPLPAFRTGQLWVAVDDGDNAPLPLDGARLLLPSYRLRFFHPGPALRLLYGGEGVTAPRYDLALLAPRLRSAAAREVPLGPPPAPDLGSGTSQGATRWIFWGALGLAVVGLLALVARLLLTAGDGTGGT